MASPATYLRLMQVCQVALSAYGAYQSYIAITNLRKYEETTKKLAEWSSQVEHELHKTRTTQASGAIAILASFAAATTLAVAGNTLPAWARFGTPAALLVGVLFARNHIKNYWAPGDKKSVGTRVPLPNMGDYNEAQRRTEEVLKTLEYLEYGWIAMSFIGGMIGYK